MTNTSYMAPNICKPCHSRLNYSRHCILEAMCVVLFLGEIWCELFRVGSHVVFAWIHCMDFRIHCTDILIECR